LQFDLGNYTDIQKRYYNLLKLINNDTKIEIDVILANGKLYFFIK